MAPKGSRRSSSVAKPQPAKAARKKQPLKPALDGGVPFPEARDAVPLDVTAAKAMELYKPRFPRELTQEEHDEFERKRQDSFLQDNRDAVMDLFGRDSGVRFDSRVWLCFDRWVQTNSPSYLEGCIQAAETVCYMYGWTKLEAYLDWRLNVMKSVSYFDGRACSKDAVRKFRGRVAAAYQFWLDRVPSQDRRKRCSLRTFMTQECHFVSFARDTRKFYGSHLSTIGIMSCFAGGGLVDTIEDFKNFYPGMKSALNDILVMGCTNRRPVPKSERMASSDEEDGGSESDSDSSCVGAEIHTAAGCEKKPPARRSQRLAKGKLDGELSGTAGLKAPEKSPPDDEKIPAVNSPHLLADSKELCAHASEMRRQREQIVGVNVEDESLQAAKRDGNYELAMKFCSPKRSVEFLEEVKHQHLLPKSARDASKNSIGARSYHRKHAAAKKQEAELKRQKKLAEDGVVVVDRSIPPIKREQVLGDSDAAELSYMCFEHPFHGSGDDPAYICGDEYLGSGSGSVVDSVSMLQFSVQEMMAMGRRLDCTSHGSVPKTEAQQLCLKAMGAGIPVNFVPNETASGVGRDVHGQDLVALYCGSNSYDDIFDDLRLDPEFIVSEMNKDCGKKLGGTEGVVPDPMRGCKKVNFGVALQFYDTGDTTEGAVLPPPGMVNDNWHYDKYRKAISDLLDRMDEAIEKHGRFHGRLPYSSYPNRHERFGKKFAEKCGCKRSRAESVQLTLLLLGHYDDRTGKFVPNKDVYSRVSRHTDDGNGLWPGWDIVGMWSCIVRVGNEVYRLSVITYTRSNVEIYLEKEEEYAKPAQESFRRYRDEKQGIVHALETLDSASAQWCPVGEDVEKVAAIRRLRPRAPRDLSNFALHENERYMVSTPLELSAGCNAELKCLVTKAFVDRLGFESLAIDAINKMCAAYPLSRAQKGQLWLLALVQDNSAKFGWVCYERWLKKSDGDFVLSQNPSRPLSELNLVQLFFEELKAVGCSPVGGALSRMTPFSGTFFDLPEADTDSKIEECLRVIDLNVARLLEIAKLAETEEDRNVVLGRLTDPNTGVLYMGDVSSLGFYSSGCMTGFIGTELGRDNAVGARFSKGASYTKKLEECGCCTPEQQEQLLMSISCKEDTVPKTVESGLCEVSRPDNEGFDVFVAGQDCYRFAIRPRLCRDRYLYVPQIKKYGRYVWEDLQFSPESGNALI